MKKNIFETITQFVFILFMQTIVIFISLGITMDFSRVKTTAFWVETIFQFITSMTVFNTVYGLAKRNKMHDRSSRFFIAYATNRLRVKYLEKEKMNKKLEEACDIETFENYKEKCNKKIYKFSSRICYDDVMNESAEELIGKYNITQNKYLLFSNLINKNKTRRFKNLHNKVRAGAIKVKPIKGVYFLIDKEVSIKSFDNYELNTHLETIRKNAKKSMTFFAFSFLSAIIGFAFISPNFLKTLITSITLVLSACVSGFTYANSTIKDRTALYEKRNSFLYNYLNISIEYKEETTV